MPRDYNRIKEESRARNAAASRSGRDIGELPPVAKPRRRASCKRDLKKFLLTYFPETFCLPFSPDHEKVIKKAELAILRGGLFAVAMPRGAGKTSITERSGIWALLYAHRRFVTLVGASETAACELITSIKTEFECNELLAADFPEVIYPIIKLDGIVNRARGQLYKGERTRVEWTVNEVVLPTIKGSAASGSIIRCAGITGRIRGMKHALPSGENIRPELVIIDDPQTFESAYSADQCRKRIAILQSDIIGLAGAGKKIAGIMPCTVIHGDDMADIMLDQEKHPVWQGERCKLCYAFPTNTKLWEKYEEIRANCLREKGDISDATEFYRANRAAMDEGAKAAWPERYNPDELSAVQNIMNLKLTDEASFFAEYQNEPMDDSNDALEQPAPEMVYARLNNLKRREIPGDAIHLTAMIDVHADLLYYMVCAWSENFTGYVVDYGAFPDQKKRMFTLRGAAPSIRSKFPGYGIEEATYAALDELTNELLLREYTRADGGVIKIARCLIDASWGDSTNVIYKFCRQSQFTAILLPAHGRGIGPDRRPMNEYRKEPGSQLGLNWMITAATGKHLVRHVVYDTNFWKSTFMKRLLTPMGGKGTLTVWGNDPKAHELLARHWSSEYRVETEGNGRRVDVWKVRPSSPDNHLFDCIVANHVAASICGAAAPGTMTEERPRIIRATANNRKVIKFSKK